MPYSKQSKKLGNGRGSPEPGPSKRDKHSSDEEDDPFPRKEKGASYSKMSKQGKINKKVPSVTKLGGMQTSCHNKPAELFRKDLISAMKLADTEILYESEYVVISDPWRQEWEKGVQVPVNEEEIMPLVVRSLKKAAEAGDFKLPPRKYLHDRTDETYVPIQHELTGMQEIADQIVRYDLDDQDVQWLELVNQDREEMGLQLINEWNLERMIEALENQCYTKTNALKKTEEGLGIEYDEDVACDVCRMLESEDTNEMVFCDGCDICVHQACYGIQTIPEGTWLCRICALGIKPMCLLCPKRGGAMKPTKSATKWTHVSCALWIPEVSIGCPEKMEPITKISNIPPSRWALVCCLCKERVGACIQCSVKQCKTAFHVTCGFAHNLDMRTIMDDSDDVDGIHLKAYCPKHSKNRNASDSDSPKKEESQEDEENDISEAEMAKKRMEKLNQLEEEFYTLVDQNEVAQKFYIPEEAVDIVAEYWKLKRKANNNKPLITPKMEEEDQMQRQQKDSLCARMKMFVHLRQDLERARNLCYMISKREKTKRQLFNVKEAVFRAQLQVLTDPSLNLSAREAERVRQMTKFNSLYSDHSRKSVLSGKAPRENLFTLENLKTPKDHEEEKEKAKAKIESEGKTNGKKNAEKKANASLSAKKKKDKAESGKIKTKDVNSVPTAASNKEKIKEEVDEAESDKVVSLEENNVELTDNHEDCDEASPKNYQGKVSPKRTEGETVAEEPDDIKVTEEELDLPNQKNLIPSNLRKKLTSILQSKTMMQKRQEKSDSNAEILNIDVESLDEEGASSELINEIPLPVEERRNLFDQFSSVQTLKVKEHSPTSTKKKDSVVNSALVNTNESTCKKNEDALISPDVKEDRVRHSSSHKKAKRHRHGRSSRKHKKPRRSHSPAGSDRFRLSVSPIIIKTEGDSIISKQSSRLSSESSLAKDKSPLSPETSHDASSHSPHHHGDNYSPMSLTRSGKSSKKKRSRRDRNSEGDSLRSDSSSASPIKPRRQHHHRSMLSPSAVSESSHVMTEDKLHPDKDHGFKVVKETDECSKLEDSPISDKGESRLKLHSKLRLKKQHSPVKGVISYEVIKDEEEDGEQKLKHQKDKDIKNCDNKVEDIMSQILDTSTVTHKGDNVFENVKISPSFLREDVAKGSQLHSEKDSKVMAKAEDKNEMQKMPERKSKGEEHGSKSHNPKRTNKVSVIKVKEETTDGEGMIEASHVSLVDVPPEKRTRSGMFYQEKDQSLPSDGLENSSDENFMPCNRSSKVSTVGRTRHLRRLRTTRKSHPGEKEEDGDMEDEDTDNVGSEAGDDSSEMEKNFSRGSKRKSNGLLCRGMKLKSPLPDKPEINKLLLDPSKLIVKNSLRKRVGDRLASALKGRSRWPSIRSNQTTMDKFVKRTNSYENVFSRPDIVRDPNAKRLSLPLARSDLSPLSVNKSSSVINTTHGNRDDTSLPVSPLKLQAITTTDSSPRGSLNSYHIPRRAQNSPSWLKTNNSPLRDSKASSQLSSTTMNEADATFGGEEKLQRHGLRRQLTSDSDRDNGNNPESFQRLRESNLDLTSVVNTPSKCDASKLNEDHFDGNQSYRSPSPVSSITSVASSRLGKYMVGRGEDEDDEEENTPTKRVTRSQVYEDISSCSPSSRLRSRGTILKPPKLTLS
ncbi:protein jade-1 [Plakobranchus ocellatus]|uniref:Protein jade-1 n=1 Tax=Plakobranchus ocellatus TaxID=259542 RepID=A0AAV3Z8X1_9GAST|nr:protein jade-1 [Plakobranchus ocellatus]